LQYVFLSHDVDWRRQGPPKQHILDRKDRFEPEVIEKLPTENPYYNIPKIMNIEEKYGVKSTFFFRTMYENGNYQDYEEDIKTLHKDGWEIGLHSDPTSVDDIEKMRAEKQKLESISGTKIFGNRVHYLKFNENLPQKLESLEFVYDSSTRNTKNQIDKFEMGYSQIGNLIEYPVTLMDAYLFTYMQILEDQIVPTFQRTLDYSRNLENDFGVITVLWHDNVLKMIGGRMYEKIVEFLSSQNDVKVCTGIELSNIIKKSIKS